MSIDLYTISEIFSKYQDLALLWKQTGKLQYKVCFNVNHMAELSISRNEFYKYFLSSKHIDIFRKIIVFYIKDNYNIFVVDHKSGTLVLGLFETVLHVTDTITPGVCNLNAAHAYKFDDGTSRYSLTNSVEPDKKERIIQKYINKAEFPWNMLPGSFRHPLFKVFLDVKTTYDILNSRKYCTKTIENYAKQKTLEQFDKNVALFLKKNLASCDLYVGLNARLLGINVAKIVEKYQDKREQLEAAASNIRNIVNSW
jgi:hypothetical protein